MHQLHNHHHISLNDSRVLYNSNSMSLSTRNNNYANSVPGMPPVSDANSAAINSTIPFRRPATTNASFIERFSRLQLSRSYIRSSHQLISTARYSNGEPSASRQHRFFTQGTRSQNVRSRTQNGVQISVPTKRIHSRVSTSKSSHNSLNQRQRSSTVCHILRPGNDQLQKDQELPRLVNQPRPKNHQLQADRDSPRSRNPQLQADRDSLRPENHQLQADRDSPRPRNPQLQADMDSLRPENHQLQADRDSPRPRNPQLQVDRDSLRPENHQLQADSDLLRPENHQLQADRDSPMSRNHQLQAERDSPRQGNHPSRIDPEGPSFQQAMLFAEQVRDAYRDTPQIFREFIHILEEFVRQGPTFDTTVEFICGVTSLFMNDHPELLISLHNYIEKST